MKLKVEILKDAMDRKCLTQLQVAEAIGMAQSSVSNALNGRDIRRSSGKRLCEFLELDVSKVVVLRNGAVTVNAT